MGEGCILTQHTESPRFPATSPALHATPTSAPAKGGLRNSSPLDLWVANQPSPAFTPSPVPALLDENAVLCAPLQGCDLKVGNVLDRLPQKMNGIRLLLLARFPTVGSISSATPKGLRALGITPKSAETLARLCRAFHTQLQNPSPAGMGSFLGTGGSPSASPIKASPMDSFQVSARRGSLLERATKGSHSEQRKLAEPVAASLAPFEAIATPASILKRKSGEDLGSSFTSSGSQKKRKVEFLLENNIDSERREKGECGIRENEGLDSPPKLTSPPKEQWPHGVDVAAQDEALGEGAAKEGATAPVQPEGVGTQPPLLKT